MRISEGVEMLQLTARAFDQDIILNPTLVWNNDEAILIDTGMPGQTDQLKEALGELNISIEQLKVILLTHQDLDHIGCATDIRKNQMKISSYMLMNSISRILKENFRLLKRMRVE